MTVGRTIRIYLADGTPVGIRHAELVNWSGQALVCPRGRTGELQSWPECQRPGVYILVGEDEDGSKEQIYVGEAENVWLRIQSHLRGKDFWTRVVFFTSKDDNLTKVHVKYLEARIVELALDTKRVLVENGTSPQRPSLPRSERDAMEEFLGPALTLLGALGFLFLQPIAPRRGDGSTGASTIGEELFFKTTKRVMDARGAQTDEGFIVYAGSVGDAEVRSHLGKMCREQRDALLADGSIKRDGDKVRFSRDVLFTSPSAAAAVLAGGAYNGREAWKDAAGKSLKELEEEVADATTASPSRS